MSEGRTTVKATCTHCDGEQMLSPSEVTMARQDGEAVYSFTCPGCGAACRKPANQRVLDLLAQAGLVLPPAVPVPPPPLEYLPLFTAEDSLRFHYMLESDADVEGATGHWGEGV